MVSIPRTQESVAPQDDILHLTESSAVILAILNTIYPRRPRPELKTFSFVLQLARAADKYDILDLTTRIRDLISLDFKAFPGTVLEKYILASFHRWDEDARYISQFIPPINTEDLQQRSVLETMDTAWLLKLISLHRRRQDALNRALSIGYNKNASEDVREQRLRWEVIAMDHAEDCRSQAHDKTIWAAFKLHVLTEINKYSPDEALQAIHRLCNDNRTQALWDEECTKCNTRFLSKSYFILEFGRIINRLPKEID
ncbi:hypothetical protein M0805_000204 [Coniferiporia weirii]|nr:hypothetical protein M0805_000204 [Coniferiporia weirii]